MRYVAYFHGSCVSGMAAHDNSGTMEYHNLTSFPSLPFASLDKDDRRFHVIVLRGTYAIQADGSLRAAQEQAPLLTEDEYYEKPDQSSVKQESDLAPYKPCCDVVV